MKSHRKFWALFFLSIFSLMLLHEYVPHKEYALEAIVWDGEEHSGADEHHDDIEDDFHGLPVETHQDIPTQDFLVESRGENLKKSEKDKSDFLVTPSLEIDDLTLIANGWQGSDGISLYTPLCHLTFSLRGPPAQV